MPTARLARPQVPRAHRSTRRQGAVGIEPLRRRPGRLARFRETLEKSREVGSQRRLDLEERAPQSRSVQEEPLQAELRPQPAVDATQALLRNPHHLVAEVREVPPDLVAPAGRETRPQQREAAHDRDALE